MTVARTWANSINPKYPFQTAPGEYDAAGLEALDYVLDAAGRHGLHLILSFVDNWKYYNGVDQYLDWSKSAPGRSQPLPTDAGGDTDSAAWTVDQKRYETARHALFFTDPDSRRMYKEHVEFLVNRVNSINGCVCVLCVCVFVCFGVACF